MRKDITIQVLPDKPQVQYAIHMSILLSAVVSLLSASALAVPNASPGEDASKMTQIQASSFARLALKAIEKEYPNKPEHVLNSEMDVRGPRALHPAFYGSFDLPEQTYPIRTGVHPNTAFGLSFALDYARAVGHKPLQELIEERSRTYFAEDVAIPAAWEPGGTDFFSPSLMEADLIRRVLPPNEFHTWLRRFLPGLEKGEPKSLFVPAQVTDRTDPQLVHLDGLNLSRAWCMVQIAAALSKDDPARRTLADSAARHVEAALPHVASGDYMGEHWLATFAVYLLSAPSLD